MTPDYTYGHTVTKSMQDYLTKNGGWTTVTNQVSPLGAPDFSPYLAQHRQLRRRRSSSTSTGAATRFCRSSRPSSSACSPKMKLVVPYQIPFLAREAGPELMEGVYAATDYWWTLEDKYPLAKMFNEAFEKKYGYKPEWGAENAYISFAHWARMVEEAGTFYPPDVIKAVREGREHPLAGRRRALPQGRPPVRPPGHHRQGQGAQGHEEQGRLSARWSKSCRARR